MAKEITHWYLAESIFQELNDRLYIKQIIKKYKHVYMIGAVIFDSPFYIIADKRTKEMISLADKFHDTQVNSYEPLQKLIRHYGSSITEPVLAFILGIITHIHTDSKIHPFVYYYSGSEFKNRKISQIRHRYIEAYIDACIMEKTAIDFPRTFKKIIKNIEIDMKEMIKIINTLYNIKIPIKSSFTKKIIRYHQFFQKSLHKRWLIRFIKLLNVIPGVDLEYYSSLGYDYKNINKSSVLNNLITYHHPVTDEKCHHSLEDIFRKTISEVQNVFNVIEKHWDDNTLVDGFSLFEGFNLYTGMPVFQNKDIKYYDMDIPIKEVLKKI